MQQVTPQAPGSVKVPTTQLEMRALQMQRGELKDQLAGLNRRRNQLQEQRSGLEGAAARDNDLRIREIDQRASEIDRTLMRLDVAIADGLAKPLFDDFTGNDGPAPVQAGQPGTTVPPPGQIDPRAAGDRIEFLLTSGALVALAGFVLWQGIRRFFLKPSPTSLAGQAQRLEQLQQSVDVIAIEMERMSESNRFVAKVLNEKFPALGIGEAQPVSVDAKEKAPAKR